MKHTRQDHWRNWTRTRKKAPTQTTVKLNNAHKHSQRRRLRSKCNTDRQEMSHGCSLSPVCQFLAEVRLHLVVHFIWYTWRLLGTMTEDVDVYLFHPFKELEVLNKSAEKTRIGSRCTLYRFLAPFSVTRRCITDQPGKSILGTWKMSSEGRSVSSRCIYLTTI